MQEHKKELLVILTIFVIVASILGGCAYINHKLGLDDDNAVEELIEGIIKEEIGADIDLTPNSPEK